MVLEKVITKNLQLPFRNSDLYFLHINNVLMFGSLKFLVIGFIGLNFVWVIFEMVYRKVETLWAGRNIY